ncbi:RHS repeat protein [Salmonella enterica]|nr:RHS repeat protein [Salmonella enterica]EBE4966614.1 RHS repeat protein [Salmonella enterica]EBT5331605.1 RHS repeat protein [Salmonella enterica]ECH4619389.1 RHS repeat protein [Salmonella enterica]EGG9186597.1 RHS repeat protein [Salmonella enterica]
MSTLLFSQTPSVTVLDNRGLTVRDIAYHRHPDTPDITSERITRHQYDARSFLTQSADPRLHDAGLANFTYLTDLAGNVLRSQGVDNGITVALNDAAGRAFIAVSNISTTGDGPVDRSQAVTRTWQYEDASLPGRPLSITEQVNGEAARITERFVYAGHTDAEKALNLAGACVSHYDTAGLTQTDSVALTGVPLSVSRRLLKDADNPDAVADWKGEDATAWNDLLDGEAYNTQTTADATGAVLTSTDAKGNLQRVAYDVAGLLSGNWLTVKGGTEQVIVASLTYSAAGQKLREEHGNGVVTTYTYEAETQRLTGIKTERPAGHASGARVLQDLRYEYDPVGNVLCVRNDAEETRFWRNQKVVPENTYVYDSLYQLVSATGREMADAGQQGSSLPSATIPFPTDSSAFTNYTRNYIYDEAGNLMQVRHSAPATNNSYTTNITVSDRSNRAVLSSLAETPAEVDALFTAGGQQKQLQPGQSLVWTPRSELLKVTPVARDGGADDSESYRYDTDSQRILKVSVQETSGTTQTQRVLYLTGLELRTMVSGNTETESLQVITTGEAGRAQVRVLHWESGTPEGVSNDQVRYSYDNLTGCSQLELDSDGNIISMEEYYPYGGTAVWAARNAMEADYKTVRYSGKERDVTGLYYYGYRYYQPWVRRWLSADLSGTVDGLNLFRMLRNNPVIFVDPDGLRPHPSNRIQGSKLYHPKLKTGDDRNLPGASLLNPSRMEDIDVKGTPIELEKVLEDHALETTPLLTDLINTSKVPMDQITKNILANQAGGILNFNAIRFSISDNENIHALQIVDAKTTANQIGKGFISAAYWAPQGGYVDIPARPETGPKLVFTPGFSGCTFVADKLNENTIRVRHVQGGKEDLEYNNLPATEHGLGMIDAMEYSDYGYHEDSQKNSIENITGSAFMIFKDDQWNIKYQSLANAPGISSLREESIGFFNKKTQLIGKIRYSEGKNVVKTKTLPLHH